MIGTIDRDPRPAQPRLSRAAAGLLVALLALAGCEDGTKSSPPAGPYAVLAGNPAATGRPASLAPGGVASDRLSGPLVPRPTARPGPLSAAGAGVPLPLPPPPPGGPADVTIDFVDADIREIASFLLGQVLGLSYTIDPSVQGTATLQTAKPVARDSVLPTLQALLSSSNATITYESGLYRVVPISALDLNAPLVPPGSEASGSQVVPLRYASARRLAEVLQPLVPDYGRVVADPARNALVVSGAGPVRGTLLALIRTFDVNALAGQSYALFPVKTGEATFVAGDLQKVLQAESEGAYVDLVRVIPIERANAVLVISPQQAYVDRAGQILRQIVRLGDSATRKLHVYYPQNVAAAELQPVLAKIFVGLNSGPGGGGQALPGGVTPAAEAVQLGAAGGGGTGASAGATRLGATSGGGFGGGGGFGESGGGTSGFGGEGGFGQGGGLDQGFGQGTVVPAVLAGGAPGQLQVIADTKRNALLVNATDEELALVMASIEKLDILPRQVLIEATIAEVTLNDQLRYGTQFFFRQNGFGGLLTNATSAAAAVSPTVNNEDLFTGILNPEFPAFGVFSTRGPVQFALQVLDSVTDVTVVSSPQLLILENEKARLQVGDLVPVITQSSQSTTSADAPVVNNVEYRETGVILTVTPKVSAGDLVTLEIEQEVSDVVATTSSTIDSPTFQQRKIQSRVVVGSGETISLAGLIRDSSSGAKQGIPVLKDIPVLGNLFSTTSSSKRRTELLVLITPRVVKDQREARELTEELRRKLTPGSLIPIEGDAPAPPLPPLPSRASGQPVPLAPTLTRVP